MLKLVGKTVLMAVLVVAGLVALFFAVPVDAYMPAHKVKVDRLKSLGSPKLIVVGGSNVSMSIDSARLEAELGIPAVNMGLHAGIGLRFMLDEVMPHLGAGDIVVLSPEYHQFYDGLHEGETGLVRVLRADPPATANLRSLGQWIAVVRNIPVRLKAQFRRFLAEVKSRKPVKDAGEDVMNAAGMNAHGDSISHLNVPSPGIEGQPLFKSGPGSPDPEALEIVREFHAEAGKAGAKVFFYFPPVPEPEFKRYSQRLSEVDTALGTGRLPLLNRPEESAYDPALFFNTVYHLNRKGRAIHTKRLLHFLRDSLEPN